MANLSRLSSRGARGVLGWIDAGRSSVVVALGIALIVPSVNVVVFDGLPLDRPSEIFALAALLPFAFSSSLRARLAGVLGRGRKWGPRLVLTATVAVIVVKLLLLVVGSDRGFVACYASTWRPPPQRCEGSYSNVFHRHGGATRIDDQIDFGPSEDQASRMVGAYPTYVYTRGAAGTNWNLSFSNDLRFNEAHEKGIPLHELMPFAATWEGTAAIPDDGVVRIRYVGRGAIRIGTSRVLLPSSNSPRTVIARVPPGDRRLDARFAFPKRASQAELRFLNRDGAPILAAEPAAGKQIAAVAVWIVLATLFAGLALTALLALGRDLWPLGLVACAAVAIVLLSSPQQHVGFQYLAALLAPIMLLRLPRRPVLWAFVALLVVEGAGILNSVPDLHAVLYRTSGSDFLTYESFARNIVLDHSLSGGESVFFYQPGSRYVLGFMHLLFGDGDVLVTWWSMVAVSLPFLALLAWNRRRSRSPVATLALSGTGFLLLALLNSSTVLSLVALATSEVPTWALLPLAVAAPQLRPTRAAGWVGSAAAAAFIFLIRTNQALGALTILASIAARLWNSRRRLLWVAAGTALLVALLPAIHNLYYGHRFVPTTTSGALTQEVQIGQLVQAFSDNAVGGLIRGHLSAILYDPPTPGLTHESLAWLLWGLLAIWLVAVAVSLARLRERETSVSDGLLLFLPVAYLAPHLLYQVEVYFPRHIIVGYLAMGVAAAGVLGRVTVGSEWSSPLPLWIAARRRTVGARVARLPTTIAAAASRMAKTTRRGAGSVSAAIVNAAQAFWAAIRSLGKGLRSRTERLSPILEMVGVDSEYRGTAIGLIVAAVLAPFSATHIAGPLTLGRAALLLFAALLAADLLREQPRRFLLSAPTVLLASAYVGLSVWIFLNAAAWGCNCDGKAGGFYEFAVIGLLALVAIGFEPRLRGPAIVATLAGIVLASTLALLGVGALNSGTVDLTQTGGRLSGTFGNANELGFAAALGIPIVLAYRAAADMAGRIAVVASLLILSVTLVLTFSRGAIIAAAAGVLALALWEARRSRRHVLVILGAATVCALVGAVLYSVFEQQRKDASFEAVPAALRPLDQVDQTGWDSRAQGPIPRGPSDLFNRGSSIAVRSDRGGEGTSFRWGEAAAGGAYTLRFKARAEGAGARIPFSYALGENARIAGVSRAETVLDKRWRVFSLPWKPGLRAPHATLYMWQRGGPSTFAFSDVRVIHRDGHGSGSIAIPGHLRGSQYDKLTSEATRDERRYVRSRVDAAHLAFNAFKSEPLRGIGWSTFPIYSAAHSHYGQLAAHNEYLGIAAELGIIGLMLLGLMITAVAVGVRRADSGRPAAAAIGVVAAAAVGLVFVEALPVPQLAITLAIAAAVLCAQRRREAD